MSGVNAFREAFMSADLAAPLDFNDVTARRMRYAVLWAFYENTAYRDVHAWAQSYRVKYGLYKYSRNIYNPAFRLGSFWQTFLMGGTLDPAAGDGTDVQSALPIITGDPKLRTAISTGWRNSNWNIRKNILTLYGNVLGDVGLRVIDDPQRQKAYLDIVHPSLIDYVVLDDRSNIKGYKLSEQRPDPRKKLDAQGKTPQVKYSEIVSRDGDAVIYETFLDDKPYGWIEMADGTQPTEWSLPYGFVPFVLIKHNDVGLDWGWSELYPDMSKVREVDDLASKTSDQIRKLVDAPWLLGGVTKSSQAVRASGAAKSDESPEPGREEIPIIYGPAGATATPLVAPLDLAAAETKIQNILAEIERDYPELNHDIWSVGNDPSGKALRISRQPVVSKVENRRTNYDDALVKAQQMLIAISGYRNYADFSGFDLDSYAAGKLDHTIDPKRPVFAPDEADVLDLERSKLMLEQQRLALAQMRNASTGT